MEKAGEVAEASQQVSSAKAAASGTPVQTPKGRANLFSEEGVGSMVWSAQTVQGAEAKVHVEGNDAEAAAAARRAELLKVVESVCDSILITPEVLRGEGKIQFHLKSDVLGGSEVEIVVVGRSLAVNFLVPTPELQQLLELNRGQLESHLAEFVHRYQVKVSVKREKHNEQV
jgi:hypothetical protein